MKAYTNETDQLTHSFVPVLLINVKRVSIFLLLFVVEITNHIIQEYMDWQNQPQAVREKSGQNSFFLHLIFHPFPSEEK